MRRKHSAVLVDVLVHAPLPVVFGLQMRSLSPNAMSSQVQPFQAACDVMYSA